MIERVRALLTHKHANRVLTIGVAVMLTANLAALGPVAKKTDVAAPGGLVNDGAPTAGATPGTPLPGATGTAPGTTLPTVGPGVTGVQPTKKPVIRLEDVPGYGLLTQGVTATEVKIGISWNKADCGDQAVLNATYANAAGDPSKAVTAFTDHINATGGIGGKRLVSKTFDDGGAGCPEKNIQAAVQMLNEEKVFMALPGLHAESDYLIQRHLPVFGGREDPASLKKYGANGLQVIHTQEVTMNAWASFGRYYLKTNEHTPCLIRIENGAAGDFDTAQRTLERSMTTYGLKFKQVYVFKDDVSTAQQQSDNIVASAKDQGCDQVWFMAGNAVGLIFMTDAATRYQWFPTWTFTSSTYLADDDVGGALMNKAQWENAIGISYRVPASEHPYANNCKEIYEDRWGADGFSESAATKIACAQILTVSEMMRRAIELTGTLNADTLLVGADAIDYDFFYDATVPMDFRFPGPQGPFRTRGFGHFTVVDWSSSQQKYTFPAYPCYYEEWGPNNGGCGKLDQYFKKAG